MYVTNLILQQDVQCHVTNMYHTSCHQRVACLTRTTGQKGGTFSKRLLEHFAQFASLTLMIIYFRCKCVDGDTRLLFKSYSHCIHGNTCTSVVGVRCLGTAASSGTIVYPSDDRQMNMEH